MNGENAAPIYKLLKSSKGGFFGEGIKWNFTKFLVDKDGNVVDRYAPTTSPLSIEVIQVSSIHSMRHLRNMFNLRTMTYKSILMFEYASLCRRISRSYCDILTFDIHPYAEGYQEIIGTFLNFKCT